MFGAEGFRVFLGGYACIGERVEKLVVNGMQSVSEMTAFGENPMSKGSTGSKRHSPEYGFGYIRCPYFPYSIYLRGTLNPKPYILLKGNVNK